MVHAVDCRSACDVPFPAHTAFKIFCLMFMRRASIFSAVVLMPRGGISFDFQHACPQFELCDVQGIGEPGDLPRSPTEQSLLGAQLSRGHGGASTRDMNQDLRLQKLKARPISMSFVSRWYSFGS